MPIGKGRFPVFSGRRPFPSRIPAVQGAFQSMIGTELMLFFGLPEMTRSL